MYAYAGTFTVTQLYTRADGGGGGGLSTQTIIIISVVCGSVAILALTLFLWRYLTRCCRSKKSAPLPPVQDLAHRREQQLAATFTDRYDTNARRKTWLDVSTTAALSQTGSSVSLLTTPEKNVSIYTDDATTIDSTAVSPVTLSPEDELHPPNPMFYPPPPGSSPHVSMISTASGSSTYSSLPGTHGPSSSPSAALSDVASLSMSAESGAPLRPSRSQTQSRNGSPHNKPRASSRGLGRPQSQLSLRTSHSGHTARSTSTRGAPHRPYSNVQIVLPAPLGSHTAPQVQPQQPHGSRTSAYGPSSRHSVFADQWVLAGSRQPNPAPDERNRRKSTSASQNLPSRNHNRSSSTPAQYASSSLPSSNPQSATTPPSSSSNRRSSSQHARSASSLRHEVQRLPPPFPSKHSQPSSPSIPSAGRTYSNLADLAESSFEVNDFMRDRGRMYASPVSQPQSPKLPSKEPSSPPPHSASSQARRSSVSANSHHKERERTTASSSRPRSQSQPKSSHSARLHKQRDPVR